MKLKEGFVLRQVAGNYVVFPVGESTVDFHGMLALNETGAFLWEKLSEGADREALRKALCAEYDDCETTALFDIDVFIKKLCDAGCLEIQ